MINNTNRGGRGEREREDEKEKERREKRRGIESCQWKWTPLYLAATKGKEVGVVSS